MNKRPYWFLSEKKIDHDGEIFDYILELHDYLWRTIRAAYPGAGGSIQDWIDPALEKLEYKRDERLKRLDDQQA